MTLPNRSIRAPLWRPVAAVVVLAAIVVGGWLWMSGGDRLVVYCAHDAVFADGVFREFERRTGIGIAVRYDTEATKSLGLVELLLVEKDRPRCDVFWNNEVLGMLELAERDVLLPYQGAGYAATPDAFKDPAGRWTGFAARLRVWLVNTQAMPPTEEAVQARLRGDLSAVAMAKPLYGTTRTHYTVLWKEWGAGRVRAWHRDWRSRGLREVAGNAMVKDAVAAGICALGLTDTDDAFVARDEGRPVAMLPVRLDDGRTICIPNSVAIIRGTRRLAQARGLVEFLLSPEAQLMLARSRSRQIPLCAVPDAALPAEVRELKRWAGSAYPLADLGRARVECLEWLKAEL